MKERENWIDLSKGIAIFLVVVGHVITIYISANMFQQYQSYMKYVHFTIYSFHMPLFFMLSGYLYIKTEPNNGLEQYKKLIIKKIIGLGIPYIIFSIIQGSVQVLLSRFTNNKIAFSTVFNILTTPILQFWYIYTLLIIFILVPLLDLMIKNDKIVFIILLLCNITSSFVKTNIMAIDYFLGFAFYFYFGKMLFKYYKAVLNNRKLLFFISIIYVVLNVFEYFSLYGVTYEGNRPFIMKVLNVVLAICGSLFVIYITRFYMSQPRTISKIINVLGIYSFEIYIFHILFAFGAKTILTILGIHNILIHLGIDTLVGIVAPLVIVYIAKKISFIYYLIYPYKFFKDSKIIKG